MSDINIKHVRGREGLSSIEDEWNFLTGSMARKRYFHLYQWHQSYINSFEDDDRSVYFFLMSEKDQPIAIVPLALRKTRFFGIPISIFKTYPDTILLGGITDCIIAENNRPLLSLLIDYLNTSGFSWHVIDIWKCLDDSCLTNELEKDPKLNFVRKHIGFSGYITKATLDEISNEVATRKQKKSNRKLKKLRKMGDVEISVASKTDDLRHYLDRFMITEASGWKGASGTAIISDPNYKEFFYQLTDALSQIDACEINLLNLDGNSIAGLIGLVIDDTYYALKIAYDENYSNMSPGLVLFDQVFRRLSEQGTIQECNFITNINWMSKWNPNTNTVCKVIVFNRSLPGRIGSLAYRMTKLIRLPIRHA